MKAIRRRLLTWYAREARDLPWRKTRDPYAIWVSEVMLQQTRVATVIPYYQRFMKRFPTARALAEASTDDVMTIWSGLGYYRRARLLHAGVREVVARYGGHVPEDTIARRSLPGIGRYTAGAIGSICFDREEAVVDGNVARVFSRHFGIDLPLDRPSTQRRFWELAEALVQGPKPGDLNQAIMELGATLCIPRTPACPRCPLSGSCVALREGRQLELPVPTPRAKVPRQSWIAVVPVASRSSNPCVWLTKREGDLFGGLWSVPLSIGDGAPSARQVLREAGLSGRTKSEPVARVEHVLSHRHLMVDVYRATGVSGEVSKSRRLVPLDDISSLGVARLTTKILDAAIKERERRG